MTCGTGVPGPNGLWVAVHVIAQWDGWTPSVTTPPSDPGVSRSRGDCWRIESRSPRVPGSVSMSGATVASVSGSQRRRATAAHFLVAAILAAGLGVVVDAGPALAEDPPDFLLAWGTTGSADGEFVRPRGIAIDDQHYVYVVDGFNHRVQKFAPDGTFVTKWGSDNSGPAQLYNPSGIAVDTAHNVYVTDVGLNRVLKFTSTGSFITGWGSTGTADGQFHGAVGVTVDGDGYVYVTDAVNNRVQKFTSDGTFVTKWGTPGSGTGQLDTPQGITADAFGNIYVSDSSNGRVQRFSSTGAYLSHWGAPGPGPGQFQAVLGIDTDSTGNVYVSTYDRVQKFSPNGSLLAGWGSLGSAEGQFDAPMWLAVSANGYVYVSDRDNDRVEVFGHGSPPPPQRSPVNYAALGDSYSSGEGVRPYFTGTDTPINRCHRSSTAYPVLLRLPGLGQTVPLHDLAGPGGPGWRFQACSGATTANVDLVGQGGRATQLATLDAWARHPTMISLTIGGNDVGFKDILVDCAQPDCLPSVYRTVDLAVDRLERHLDRLLPRLRSRATSVWLLNYPSVFPDTAAEQNCFKLRLFSRAEQNYLRSAQRRVHRVMKNAAARAGVHFVDVSGWFANHEPCADGGEWVSGPVLGTTEDPVGPGSFHPNGRGQREYARAFAVAIATRQSAGCALDPTGLPMNPAPDATPDPTCG